MSTAYTARRKIILVDDVRFSLMTSRQKLSKFYDVLPASSAGAMFKILENVRPDVILLDINMPEVDGFEAIKRLKADARLAEIPIIFLTSKNDEETVVFGMSLGANDHVAKPFNALDLYERIETLLNPDFQKSLQTEDPLQDQINAKKPCILAIDDVLSILRSIRYTLRNRFNVYTLAKPELLEEYLQKIKVTPELFLLDFNMPVVSGYDLFLKIRALPDYKQTPIIFLTAEATIDNVTAAVNLGACDFVVKPFNPAELREKVAKHIYKGEYFGRKMT